MSVVVDCLAELAAVVVADSLLNVGHDDQHELGVVDDNAVGEEEGGLGTEELDVGGAFFTEVEDEGDDGKASRRSAFRPG